MKLTPGLLVLEDGTIYKGWSFNKQKLTTVGEVVFNTAMTGYQEILTDPSYYGQIITFTYPEIGNTGVNNEDTESNKLHIKGVIIKNFSKNANNWRNNNNIIDYLSDQNILAIHGIDTRSLVKHLRTCGAMNGCITTENLSLLEIKNKIKELPKMKGLDLVKNVTTSSNYIWNKNNESKWYMNKIIYTSNNTEAKINIVVIDFGVKYNILKRLKDYGCSVIVVSAKMPIEEILNYNPDGILLSNGPGDPSCVNYGVQLVTDLLNIKHSIPIFGICMGHQILSIALGLETSKLKFGHRGPNHPAGISKKVEITSQNHGFVVEHNNKLDEIIKITHKNLNDNTLAGICLTNKPIFSVQYHPEAGPGPHDSDYMFSHFVTTVQKIKLLEAQK
uniref:Carbamoyl phosphate synthase small chain n=1 Tax=Corynoplastis japonica TaxID=700918 RepID=A0A1X9PTT6_9RHOD|nr:carbamoyl phosphate synthase small subunit [Corynoplastis japonica]